MKAMRILEWGKPLSLQQLEPPKPRGRQALIRVIACGVCHTDVHLVAGAYDLGEGKQLAMADRGIKLPVTLGHETAGVIESLGDAVKEEQPRKFQQGDSVVVFPWLGCGYCRNCKAGLEQLCEGRPQTLGIFQDGGYAEYVLVPDTRYLVELGKLDPMIAAPLACSGLTTYNAISKCKLSSEELLLVIGAGGLGTTAIQIAKKTTGARVIAVDVEDSKLRLAKDLGADQIINSRDLTTKQLVLQLKALNEGRGADAVVDFVGAPATTELGFEALAKRGRLVLVGLFGGRGSFALPMFPMRGVEVVGSYTGTLSDLAHMVQLVQRGAVRPVVSQSRALEQVNEVLQELVEGKISGRAVVKP